MVFGLNDTDARVAYRRHQAAIARSVTAILSDGVSTVLSESADPLTDRKATLEVRATIVK